MTSPRSLNEIWHSVCGSLRQLRFPPEFRIPAPESETRLLDDLERVAAGLLATAPGAAATHADSANVDHDQFLARVATGLWRLRQRMIDPASGEPREEMRRAYRHLESVWDTLLESGIEIEDDAGKPFDSGMGVSVLSHEQTSGLTREVIKETIKPTIYYHDKRIQRGEVIVGTPEEA